MKVALIDDDPVEELILSGLAENLETPVTFTAFKTLESFLHHSGAQQFDAVFLDRRIPPYGDFSETLPKLAEANVNGHIILLTARTAGKVEPPEGLKVIGPYEKLDVQDPEVLAELLAGRRAPSRKP